VPPRLVTVIDLSAEFAASEAAAIRSRFLDLADLGRLDVGCQVEVLTTSDRAARVRLVRCPADSTPGLERRAPIGTLGWVVKTALDPHPEAAWAVRYLSRLPTATTVTDAVSHVGS
jgi:hypothetical protein